MPPNLTLKFNFTAFGDIRFGPRLTQLWNAYKIIINYKCSQASIYQDLTLLGLFTENESVFTENESVEIARTPEEEVDPIDSGKMVSGLQADQEKVLAVVKNNDIDEGANLKTDFDHLGCKFLFLTKKYQAYLPLCDYFNVQWQKSNFEKFWIGYLMKDTSFQLLMTIILKLYE